MTLFQTVGFISGFFCSVYFCTNMKTYIYLAISFASFLTYGALSIKNNFQEQKKLITSKQLKIEESLNTEKLLEM